MKKVAYGVSFEMVPTFSDTTLYLFRGEDGLEEIEVELDRTRGKDSPEGYTARIRGELIENRILDPQIEFEGAEQRGGIDQSLLIFAFHEEDQRSETHLLAAAPSLDEERVKEGGSRDRPMITFSYRAQFRSGRWPEGLWARAVGLSFDGTDDVLALHEGFRRHRIDQATFYLPASFLPPRLYRMLASSGKTEVSLEILDPDTPSPPVGGEDKEIRWQQVATRPIEGGEVEKGWRADLWVTLGEGETEARVQLLGRAPAAEQDLLRAAMSHLAGSLRAEP